MGKVLKTFEFSNENERLLGRVISAGDSVNLKEGDLWILGPTAKVFHHPRNIYAYDINTNQFKGRYFIQSFEILGAYKTVDLLIDSLPDFINDSIYISAAGRNIRENDTMRKSDQIEQLSLFD